MNRFGILVLSGALLAPAIALSGKATDAKVSASLSISGITPADGGVNIGQFLTVNSADGAVVLTAAAAAAAAAGTTEPRALGVFSFGAAGVDAPQLFNRSTRQYEQATALSTVIRWDSYARVDGTFDNTVPVGENLLVGGKSSAASFSFVMAANVDPFMTYGLSVTNNTGSTQNYSFIFSESLVPTVNGPYDIYSDISGSLVNAVAGSSLDLGITVGDTVQKVRLKESNYGSFSAGVDVGYAYANPSAARGSITYNGSGLQSKTASGTSGVYTYDSWELRSDFSLTGGRDVATLSGYAEISPIPEPETYALFAAGLLAVVVMLRRRSQD